MTGTTAFRCADAPELRARDSWPQPIANDVRQVWKLGDFDAHRKEAEAVGPYTAHYVSPEVAQAKALVTGDTATMHLGAGLGLAFLDHCCNFRVHLRRYFGIDNFR